MAIAAKVKDGRPIDDFAPKQHTGYWPHLDRLIDVDDHMRANSKRGTGMVNLRLGAFIGAGNRLGLVPALTPRLRTYLVPWLAGGRKRQALVADTDLGQAFARACTAEGRSSIETGGAERDRFHRTSAINPPGPPALATSTARM